MDWDLLFGAGVALATFGVGYRYGLRKASRPVKAICPCDHGINFHEDLVGRCHGMMTASTYSTSSGRKEKDVPCTCQHYAGPELISSVTMQPIVVREVTDKGEASS